MVFVHLFKHIYSHEGFHLASGSCRFSNRCPPNTAPPAPKSMGCSSLKILSLKNRSPKTRFAPTHTPRLPNLLGHGSSQIRKTLDHKGTLHVCFYSLPPCILRIPSLPQLSSCCLRDLCYHPVQLDSAGFGFCAMAIPCHDDWDSVSRRL